MNSMKDKATISVYNREFAKLNHLNKITHVNK